MDSKRLANNRVVEFAARCATVETHTLNVNLFHENALANPMA